MGLKKSCWLLLIILLFVNLVYAGELISKEAVNYYNEGVNEHQAANLAAAEINYQKVLLLDPYNQIWQKLINNNMGIIYAQEGDLEKAEAAFNAALKIDPNYKPAQLNLGFVYETRRTKLESLEYWLKALGINLEEVKPQSFVIGELEAEK